MIRNHTKTSWTTDTIWQRRSYINTSPAYQRSSVWRNHHRQGLVDSILQGYPIPPLYIYRPSKIQYDVIDGKQRIETVVMFINDKLTVPDYSEPLFIDDREYEVANLRFSQLNDEIKQLFLDYDWWVVEMESDDKSLASDIFSRLGKGVPLNHAEQRHARVDNPIRNIVQKMALHEFWGKTGIKNTRYKHEVYAATFLYGATKAPRSLHVSNQKLNEFYDHEGSSHIFWHEGEGKQIVKSTYATLDFLNTAYPEPVYLFGTGTLLNFHLIHTVAKDFEFYFDAVDFGNWYMDFYAESLRARTEQDPHAAPELFLFAEQSSSGSTIATKTHILFSQFFREFSALMKEKPKPETRAFDKIQRVIIFNRANGQCELCSKSVNYTNFEADHVTPFSRGGKTTLDNAQCLCRECNRQKSASLAI